MREIERESELERVCAMLIVKWAWSRVIARVAGGGGWKKAAFPIRLATTTAGRL